MSHGEGIIFITSVHFVRFKSTVEMLMHSYNFVFLC